MEMSFFRRWSISILAAFILLVPLLAIGSIGTLHGVANEVRNWLPQGFEETRQYDWFLSQFGTEEMVAVSWEGATLNDPRLNEFAEKLVVFSEENKRVPNAAPLENRRPVWFRKIYTGPKLLERLTSAPLNLSVSDSHERLRGSFVGRDGEQSVLIAVLNSEGAEHRHAVFDLVTDVAASLKIPEQSLHLGGPTVDSVSLDRESDKARNLLSLISVIVAGAIAWICLRRFQLVVVVFAAALLATAMSVSVMHFSGAELDLIMVMMPPLIFVLTVSGAIHLINYHIENVQKYGTHEVVDQTIQEGRIPVILSAVTTAVGLGSLTMSEVVPVRLFGLYAAIGVLLSVPVLLLFLPALLQVFGLRPIHVQQILASEAPDVELVHWTDGPVQAIATRHRTTLIIAISTVLFVGYGLTRIKSSVRLLDLFSPQARIIQDYTWMEYHLGPLVPIEAVIRFEHSEEARQFDRLELVDAVHSALESISSVGGTMSAATFTPDLPPNDGDGLTARQMIQRRLLERKLETNREVLIEQGFLRETNEESLWRVSARVDAISDIDYGRFVEQLRTTAEPIINRWEQSHNLKADLVITGMVPLVYKAQRTLLRDLITSFVTAFGLIGILMMILLRSVRAGLLSMLPNAFPAILVFGFLGWSQHPVGIGQMMTASLALGIAVDDTIHLLNWFRREIERGSDRQEAIRNSFEHCAGAMLQTSIITGLAVLVFAFSSFRPTSSFAWMMSILLFLALLGELVLLPAILTGRWGRFFAKPAKTSATAIMEAN